MSKIVELFGEATLDGTVHWNEVIADQTCPFSGKKCFKIRKSSPDVSIGTCIVEHSGEDIIICPSRLLERKQTFWIVSTS